MFSIECNAPSHSEQVTLTISGELVGKHALYQSEKEKEQEDTVPLVNMFVHNQALVSTHSFTWSKELNDKALTIHESDKSWPNDGKFYLSFHVLSAHLALDYILHVSCVSKPRPQLSNTADMLSSNIVSMTTAKAVTVGVNTPLYTSLTNGIPYNDTLGGNNVADRTYSVYISSGAGDVHITVTPTVGDPDLYVSADGIVPTPSSYQWYSNHFGADDILIRTTDPNYCSGCTYLITVHAFGRSLTSFVLLASTDSSITTLQNAVPVSVSIALPTRQLFFQIPSQSSQSGLWIILTALSGDPDLYVSTVTQRPGPTNYQWCSTRYGSDSLTIAPICSSCVYYISVFAADARSVLAQLTASFGNVFSLVDGTPSSGSVGGGLLQYYSIDVPTASTGTSNLTVTLTVTSGRAYMLMSANVMPNATYYTWNTLSWVSTQQIQIVQNSTACPTSCTYFIGVAGVVVSGGSGTSNYNLLASVTADEYTHTILTSSVPITDSVAARQYHYYSYDATDNTVGLVFTLTALSGDPDLYISTLTAYPNTTTYQYRSTNFGNDSVSIAADQVSVGMYYVAVYGFSSTQYSIVVSPNLYTTVLINGVPQSGYVGVSQYTYYRFDLNQEDTGTTLTFTVTPQEGSNPIQVVVGIEEPPTINNYIWTSNREVVITNAQPASYLIGVYGYLTTYYTISAATSSVSNVLQAGVPIEDEIVTKGDSRYYSINVNEWNSNSILRIQVTPLSGGDPDLFVSTSNVHPNITSFTWKGTATGGDSVNITGTDPGACGLCTYYITVQSYTANDTYTIVAAFPPSDVIALTDGTIQNGDLDAAEYSYYSLMVPPGASSVAIYLNAESGSPQLYASTHAVPSSSSYMWEGTTVNSQSKILLTSSSPDFCSDCTYYISVYSADESSTFYVVASTT